MTRFIQPAMWLLLLPVFAGAAESSKSEFNAALRVKANPAHGAELFTQCVSCHGVDGNGELGGSTPRVAGQHYRVLVKQLVEFRHGERWDFRMEGMADQHHLEGVQDIADVSAHIAALPTPEERGIGSGEFSADGGSIYAAKCKSCHGVAAEGNASRGVPRLAGQHFGYLMRQMYDAVDGRRPALPHLHSERIAPLNFEQVRAVSDYMARIGWQPGDKIEPAK
jgi:cytochrome c553